MTTDSPATRRRKRVHFALDRLPWQLWPVSAAAQWVACLALGHELIHWPEACCAYCSKDLTDREPQP